MNSTALDWRWKHLITYIEGRFAITREDEVKIPASVLIRRSRSGRLNANTSRLIRGLGGMPVRGGAHGKITGYTFDKGEFRERASDGRPIGQGSGGGDAAGRAAGATDAGRASAPAHDGAGDQRDHA